jgi:hypothetical protein
LDVCELAGVEPCGVTLISSGRVGNMVTTGIELLLVAEADGARDIIPPSVIPTRNAPRTMATEMRLSASPAAICRADCIF